MSSNRLSIGDDDRRRSSVVSLSEAGLETLKKIQHGKPLAGSEHLMIQKFNF